MEEILYESLSKYFEALSNLGYIKNSMTNKLLVLYFYKKFITEDYRGFIQESDYHEIERALNCLFGTTCLIPYPDYLKMGKLKLGEISELSYRIKEAEASNRDVYEEFRYNSEIIKQNYNNIVRDADRLDRIESRLDSFRGTEESIEGYGDSTDEILGNNSSRLHALERSKVVKIKEDVITIDDIEIP